ncbi:hypothetical protein FJ987_00735 [Mesorhizobium sp. CU2]|uniref:XylR N-terminal domain-containing protein n=1 Tax=unclassified Mesorhizobium TaxID=325217 RepID=UPI001128C4C4|nr:MULTISPECIES: XylR N-terminal domain-containing protein [unclassified Mesorhizobium]TPN89376.1 hypothetical protein FJ988_00185 [Mesorhizobium sp. CU3]TPO22261.1 hypothetical protein FJ987_00735 [Mesorhizobium sp. CU2]
MRPQAEPSKLLDRGGRPTVRELLSSLVFNPVDGTISLNGDRIVVQRAAVGSELRRELIRLLGAEEAKVFLIRLGFLTGQADARFVRTRWPHLDIGDAFTAGTRMHTFSGVVRVETVYNDFDFRKGRFAAEFLWHDSVEASHFRNPHHAAEPMCWTQIGYASGYATEFFNTLVIYKEIECAAQGHRHCRVVGKPASAWGASDPEVIFFRERVVGQQEITPSVSVARTHIAHSHLSELDGVLLRPVKDLLDRFAMMGLPVLVTGAAGTGRSRAACYLHRLGHSSPPEPRHVIGSDVDVALCSEIAQPGKQSRRGPIPKTVIIDEAQAIPVEMQSRLSRAIEDGILLGGPRVIALADSVDAFFGLSPALWSVLSPLHVRMPSFVERRQDCLNLAGIMVRLLASRMGIDLPEFDETATSVIAQTQWRGNLRQLRGVLTSVLALHQGGSITGEQIEVQLAKWASGPTPNDDASQGLGRQMLELMERNKVSLSDMERAVYQAAVDLADGNLSAAARLLGLSRPQLAYRLGS